MGDNAFNDSLLLTCNFIVCQNFFLLSWTEKFWVKQIHSIKAMLNYEFLVQDYEIINYRVKRKKLPQSYWKGPQIRRTICWAAIRE